MGLITEMFLTFDGYLKPEVGDRVRISCLFKGVVRDAYTVVISKVLDCVGEPETVLVQVEKMKYTSLRSNEIYSTKYNKSSAGIEIKILH